MNLKLVLEWFDSLTYADQLMILARSERTATNRIVVAFLNK